MGDSANQTRDEIVRLRAEMTGKVIELRKATERPIRIAKTVAGPTAEERERERSLLWGRVEKGDSAVEGIVETLEGYALTAETAVAALREVLAGSVKPGVWTPSQAFGTGFIATIRNTTMKVGRPSVRD